MEIRSELPGKVFSVGYNASGQEFFDTINEFRDHIHSFFFSLTESSDLEDYNTDDIVDGLRDSFQYGLPGNLLLNCPNTHGNWSELIWKAMGCTNLQGVTLWDPMFAKDIKFRFPELEIHTSVKYADKVSNEELLRAVEGVVDVVNISVARSYSDHEFIDKLRALGIKIKIITNEECILGRREMYNKLPGFEDAKCDCTRTGIKTCALIREKYPWTKLCNISLYKESLQYHYFDILKLATRRLGNATIKTLLEYWCGNERTKMVGGIYIDESVYPIFLDWVKTRSTCSMDCNACRKCETFYTLFNG